MFKTYKKTMLSSRIIAVLVLASFSAVVAWNYKVEVLPVVSGIIGLAFIAEAFFFHRKLTLVAILTFVHLLLIAVLSTIVLTTIEEFTDSGVGTYIAAGGIVVGIFATFVSILGSYLYGQGRLWVNVLVSYILYNLASIILVLALPMLSYAITSLIALGIVIVYIALRHFVSLHKETIFDLNTIPSQKNDTVMKSNISNMNSKFLFVENDKSERILTFHDEKNIFILLPISPEKYFTIIKNDAFVDQKVVTGIFELMIKESRLLSKKLKINQKYIVPIIYVSKSSLDKDITTLKIRSKKYPEKLMGRVFIVNKAGLPKLFNKYEESNILPKKILHKLT
jgi:hypothetical protein